MSVYDDDELDEDRDDPQPEDLAELGGDEDDDDDEPSAVRCPACGHSFYRGAAKCPRCGEWMMDETPASREVPGWLWPTMVGLLIAVIVVIWHGLGR